MTRPHEGFKTYVFKGYGKYDLRKTSQKKKIMDITVYTV